MTTLPNDSGPSSWVSALGNRFSKLDPTSMVVFSVVCVIVLVMIITYIIWRVRRSDLKSTVLVKDPIQMFGSGVVPLSIDQTKIPPCLSGQEYSYSFWVYIVQYTPASAPMMLFGRGSQANNQGGSPIVFLDQNTNKMYVSIAINSTTSKSVAITSVATSTAYVTAQVDYVPMQRWVNIAFVIQDYLLTVYMDGDIYTVRNVTDSPDASSPAAIAAAAASRLASTQAQATGAAVPPPPPRPSFSSSTGSIVVGDSKSQPQAFMSQLLYFNYSLTQQDVYACYSAGPMSPSAMALIGIPAYGIRSPLYRIG